MNRLKDYIRENPKLYRVCLFLFYMFRPLSPAKFFNAVGGYIRYFIDLIKYFNMEKAERFRLLDLYPSLEDWTKITPVDRHYFYQDTWAAEKIIKEKPRYHVDVGSTALLVGILSKITRVCSVDLRPLPVKLENLECKRGSIVDLPFKDGEIGSLSSLCVIEHIGLGRYGDKLDPLGSFKAINELSRVLCKGGNLYVSVPVGEEMAVHFNAYRTFETQNLIESFKGFKLLDTLFIFRDRFTVVRFKE